MKERAESTPPSSPRKLEEHRLRAEANGTLAPAQPGIFSEERNRRIERLVQEGLKKFDAQQNPDDKLQPEMKP